MALTLEALTRDGLTGEFYPVVDAARAYRGCIAVSRAPIAGRYQAEGMELRAALLGAGLPVWWRTIEAASADLGRL